MGFTAHQHKKAISRRRGKWELHYYLQIISIYIYFPENLAVYSLCVKNRRNELFRDFVKYLGKATFVMCERAG